VKLPVEISGLIFAWINIFNLSFRSSSGFAASIPGKTVFLSCLVFKDWDQVYKFLFLLCHFSFWKKIPVRFYPRASYWKSFYLDTRNLKSVSCFIIWTNYHILLGHFHEGIQANNIAVRKVADLGRPIMGPSGFRSDQYSAPAHPWAWKTTMMLKRPPRLHKRGTVFAQYRRFPLNANRRIQVKTVSPRIGVRCRMISSGGDTGWLKKCVRKKCFFKIFRLPSFIKWMGTTWSIGTDNGPGLRNFSTSLKIPILMSSRSTTTSMIQSQETMSFKLSVNCRLDFLYYIWLYPGRGLT